MHDLLFKYNKLLSLYFCRAFNHVNFCNCYVVDDAWKENDSEKIILCQDDVGVLIEKKGKKRNMT